MLQTAQEGDNLTTITRSASEKDCKKFKTMAQKEQALCEAIKDEDLSEVEECLKNGARVNVMDEVT